MTPFAIAGVQMHVSGLSENVTAMRHQIDVLMGIYPWVQMVLFSELAPYGPLPKNAQSLPNATEESFQESAARHGIWLIPGSMFEQVGEEIYNTASVINPAGEVVGRYRKMFPFYPYEHGISPGLEFMVFDVPEVGRFGLSICYDAWFPETTRTLTSMGVEVLLIPCSPAPSTATWSSPYPAPRPPCSSAISSTSTAWTPGVTAAPASSIPRGRCSTRPGRRPP